ncbi:hypothetical protein [Parageobacillus galactosidasius]|uniref:SbsA Ig-like domain-containing protein n=1 Tax=Parageobacillus galactosidasius TaxID=883812 RepID=A0A226QMC4_9BACL|nr:hypothetical protein [Parageobacillus galactosidasius]OXB93018.1 hypothetical protein B9L23_18015 [Parageobacillus galactosidasius]
MKLSEDGKTVTVTLGTAITQQQTKKEVVVQNIKDVDGRKIEQYKTDITFLDLTIPTVESVKQIGPKEVQVFFSEPVDVTVGTSGGFLIDGGKYSATVKSVDAASNSVVLSTGTLAVGEHTLTVNPEGSEVVKDFAGLKVAKTDLKFNTVEDKEAPTLVKAEAKSQTEVILTFNEPVSPSDLGNKVYHTAETADYQAVSVVPVAGSNNTQFKVTFKNPLPVGATKILVSKEAAVDNYGNKNSVVLSTTANVYKSSLKFRHV